MPNEGWVYEGRIRPADRGARLIDLLTRSYPHSSEEEWRDRIESGQVRLDGGVVAPDAAVRSEQRLTWSRPPWEEPEAPTEFEIVHEDADLLAVAKPAGLPTLPGAGFLRNTLLARVRDRDPGATPAHRLGRWTSGLVLFARTPAARSALALAWRRREVYKEYVALCAGDPARDSFVVDAPIGPAPHPRLGTVHAAVPDGKPALSRFTVLEARGGSFVARVVIATGRPHQVRIHAAAAGHPLAGDPLYESGGLPNEDGRALPGDPGYFLHAARLRLRHPASGETLSLRATAPTVLRAANA